MRSIEEIEHRFTALKSGSDDVELYVMAIRGHADAVVIVAERMLQARQIVSYERQADADETWLVFPASALREAEPLELFAPIQAAAWEIVSSSPQR